MSDRIPAGAQTRVSVYGRCEIRQRHERHVSWGGVIDSAGNYCLHDCPGQYSDCANCDDVKCMACVFREVHDRCEDSCPECAAEGA